MTSRSRPLRLDGPLRLNEDALATVVVSGQIAHPIAAATPYRIGNDGHPRVLPGTGGIVLSHRIGDPCVGIAADHLEPGVTLHNNGREVVGPANGPNNALLTYACVGNPAEVSSGRCAGQKGLVTGKHGGINHVILDFPRRTLAALDIGDRVKIFSRGLGLELVDFPEVTVFNGDPGLFRRWPIRVRGGVIVAPVTHMVPARIMGSGLGKNTVWRGDYDIQLFDSTIRRRFRLDALRFGDMVAIADADAKYGPSHRSGHLTLGVVVHGDSTVSGHGPGVVVLMTGPAPSFRVTRDTSANLARYYDVGRLEPPSPREPIVQSFPARGARMAESVQKFR